MSDKELHRVRVIQTVCEKRLRRRDAADQLLLTERQTQRLVNRYRQLGACVHENYSDNGLWIPRSKRKPKVYQPRYRRACVGELIQIFDAHPPLDQQDELDLIN